MSRTERLFFWGGANASLTLIASACACCARRARCRRHRTTTTAPLHHHHLHCHPHPRTTIRAISQDWREKPCKFEIITPAARTQDLRAAAWPKLYPIFFSTFLFFWRFSTNPVLIRRYPWNYVYVDFKRNMDDGASTLITVINRTYLTYHTHLGDSLFGGYN
jgi:hypothetical protein